MPYRYYIGGQKSIFLCVSLTQRPFIRAFAAPLGRRTLLHPHGRALSAPTQGQAPGLAGGVLTFFTRRALGDVGEPPEVLLCILAYKPARGGFRARSTFEACHWHPSLRLRRNHVSPSARSRLETHLMRFIGAAPRPPLTQRRQWRIG